MKDLTTFINELKESNPEFKQALESLYKQYGINLERDEGEPESDETPLCFGYSFDKMWECNSTCDFYNECRIKANQLNGTME